MNTELNKSTLVEHLVKEHHFMLSCLTDILKNTVLAYEDDAFVDVRLCVWRNGEWCFRTGLVDYDQSHSSYCGADTLTEDCDPEKVLESLLDQIIDQVAA